MSNNHTYRSKLILPRSLQVTPRVLSGAKSFMQNQGLADVVSSESERIRESNSTRNLRYKRMAMQDNYDISSLWWALGGSILIFLLITFIRNK